MKRQKNIVLKWILNLKQKQSLHHNYNDKNIDSQSESILL